MLFVLSGNIQTGKTRFLCELLNKVCASGTIPFGVVAPGVWRDGDANVSVSGGYTCPEVSAFDWESAPVEQRDENAHFAKAKERGVLTAAREAAGQPDAKQALLVVDELGRMELLKDSGLTEAVALLEAGPQEGCPHALVVVREQLSGLAELRFGHKWNGYIGVYPGNEDGVKCLLSTLRVSLNGLDKSASIRE